MNTSLELFDQVAAGGLSLEVFEPQLRLTVCVQAMT